MKPIFLFLIIGILCLFSQKCIVKSDKTASSETVKLKITHNINLPGAGQQTDTNRLKQSGWYAGALKQLEQTEYNIHPVENTKAFSSPNRHNNLRFHYDANGFSVQPRTQAGWKVNFNLDEKQIGEGAWRVSANKAEYITNNITVQYINNEEGMRQNFIVQKPLAAKEELEIHFSVETELKQKFSKDRLQFVSKKTGVVLNYEQLKVWDASGKPLEAEFEKSKEDYCIHVNTANAVYPVTIDPLSTTPVATLECNQNSAFLGYAVASAGDVNGDGYSDVIIGAIGYDTNIGDAGAAFIYHGSATGISSTPAILVSGNNKPGSGFGSAVASAGDINADGYSDIVIGAYTYSNGQRSEGAVFVYYGSATGIQTATINIMEGDQEYARMGFSVAGAGDLDADGYSDIVIGAFGYKDPHTREGAIFTYHGSASGITVRKALMKSSMAEAQLGASVACAGDINGDGFSDIVAGAPEYKNGQNKEGAIYIFYGSVNGITSAGMVIIESNKTDAYWGESVAGAGDINGDGYSDIIMGSMFYNYNYATGGFFIFNGSASGLNPSPVVTIIADKGYSYMGTVAGAGDVNGDGYSDVLVGAQGYDDGETDEGAAYLYYGSASGLNTTPKLKVTSNQGSAALGFRVASAGDVNGDGYSDFIIGAPYYDNGDFNEGAAFIYHGSPAGCNTTANVTVESNQAAAGLGSSIACAGDINGDGYVDVIVGAPYYDNGQPDEGAIFIYPGNATGISTTAIRLESNVNNAYLGCSVACAGDVNGDGYDDLIAGAYQYTNNETKEGAAYLYLCSPTGINGVILECNQPNANMGYSVAGAGDVNGDGYGDVIVGAYNYDNGNNNEGAAFIYHGSASGINSTVAARLEGNQDLANLGFSVATAGDVNGDGFSDVIAGVPGYSNGNTNEGAVFIYHGSATGINTTPNARVECNQDIANLGASVACAGDINGDGYSDIIAGANLYDNTQTDEGAAFIYHGSATGIKTTAAASLVINQAGAYFGQSVAAAGDVNGDGYSDVIVCAIFYNNGNPWEGGAFLFCGSATGINTTASESFESNQNFALMNAAAGAGDVNGDGYGDVIVGASSYDNGENNEGAAFIYYGNKSGSNKRNNLKLYNNDLTTPVNNSNNTSSKFGAGLFARSFYGRTKGKLVWETRANYNAFSGTPITNSALYTSSQSNYTDLGTTGTELKSLVIKTGSRYTKIRARIKYDPVTVLNGQVYSPWRYVPDVVSGLSLGVLPVDLISFTAEWKEKGRSAQLKFITDNESDVSAYEVERSSDGVSYSSIGTVAAKNTGRQTSYSYTDNNAAGKKFYYRLKTNFNTGNYEYSNIQMLQTDAAIEIMVFPNPAKDVIQLRLNNSYDIMNVKIISAAGQTIKQLNNLSTAGQLISIPVNDLHTGIYFLYLQSGHEKQVLQFVKE